jgi:hypothetical protein
VLGRRLEVGCLNARPGAKLGSMDDRVVEQCVRYLCGDLCGQARSRSADLYTERTWISHTH